MATKPVLLFLLYPLFVSAGGVGAADRPNIVWLTSEDHGPHMGCYGDALARTPHVDALAAQGMRFRHVWSCVPVCAPARTAIISGMYPSSLGALHMRSMVPLPDEIKLYPQILREAGYYCTNNSKEDYNCRAPEHLWNESSNTAHWRNRAAGQPFLAVFNSTKSHESQIRTRPHNQVTDPAAVHVPAYHPDTPEVRQDWAQYYDRVNAADADAGARLRELEEAGLASDTIVFYYADHGSGMPRAKRFAGDSGLHVPLVVQFPEKWRHLAPRDYQVGGVSDRLVSFVDFAPTLLSLAGVEPPAWMQGHAFAGPYQTDGPGLLFGERGRMDERNDLVRSVTDGRYVYLRNYFPHVSQAQHNAYQFETPTTRVWHDLFHRGLTNDAQSIFWSVPRAHEELYDLQSDPDEVHNLAASPEHRAILDKLRQAQRVHAADIRDVCFLPEGEIHARSEGSTPYAMARDQDEEKHPFGRVFDAAERASNLDREALPELRTLLTDSDSAVRYWAALGHLMRGREAVGSGRSALHAALQDPSPYVRIAAAQCLAQYGGAPDRAAALDVLKQLAPPKTNGVFVATAALEAIDALGTQAASLYADVRALDPRGPSPDARFDAHLPKLIENILSRDRPNLIWIMADDLGYGELGCYGQSVIRTPRLDRMAAEGLRFTQFYAGATVCAPSRSVLMTGQHHGHTRVRGNAGPANPAAQALRPEDLTVAKVLSDAGYATALIGKWGLGDVGVAETGLPGRHGFEYFFGYLSQHRAHNHFPEFLWRNERQINLPNQVTPVGEFGGGYCEDGILYADDLFADEALKFVASHQHRPFFLYWSMVIPHANNERNRVLKNGAHVPDFGPYANEDWPAQAKGHAAMISRLDSYVGRMLDQLQLLGLAENTLVIFTSDNGPHGESGHNLARFRPAGPLTGIKRSLTDGGIRVPAIAWWPGRVTAGSESNHVAYFGDWFATAAELARAQVPDGLDSISFAPTLRGDPAGQQPHEFLYWEFHERGFQQAALYQGRWKGLRAHGPDEPVRLYDLHQDIREQHDLAGQHPEIARVIADYLNSARSDSPDWQPVWKVKQP